MELINPIVIYVGIPILIIISVSKLKKRDIYKNGKKVANTQYVEEIPYYKEIMKNYKRLTYFIKGVCILAILMAIILLARPAKIDTSDSIMYNRDIFLCMDVSASVNELNEELVENLKKTVESLNGERFGISIFNTSSVLLVPLTDDYEYVIEVLDQIKKGIEAEEKYDYTIMNEYAYLVSYIQSGTLVGAKERGGSLVGDGLASCIYNFTDLEENRTRIIIFSTDNDVQGEEIVTLKEATTLAKDKNITVFGIGPETIYDMDEKDFKREVEKTGGTYYTNSYSNTVSEIVKNIEQKGKNLVKGQKEVRKIDMPQIPFILLTISLMILFILNKKVKL